MPFSRARAPMASRISRDMRLLLHQVGPGDVVVGDGDDPGRGGDRHLGLRGADELTGERLVPCVVLARPDAGAPAEEAAEVRRLRQGALDARTGDLEGVVLADLGKEARDAFAERERHPLGVVDVEANRLADHLCQQHLDLGRALGEPRLDVGLNVLHKPPPGKQKAGMARSRYYHRWLSPTARKLWLRA